MLITLAVAGFGREVTGLWNIAKLSKIAFALLSFCPDLQPAGVKVHTA